MVCTAFNISLNWHIRTIKYHMLQLLSHNTFSRYSEVWDFFWGIWHQNPSKETRNQISFESCKKKKSMKLNDWQQVNRLCYSKSFTAGGKKLCFSYPDPVLYLLRRTEYYSLSRMEIRFNNNVIDVKKYLGCYSKNCFDPVSLYTLMMNKKTIFFL